MKNIISLGIWVLAILFVFTGSSIAGWGNTQAFYPGAHMMGGGYMGWSMIFFWVILLVILILVVRWIIKLSQSDNAHQTALDLLKKRLANGEIDIEEFKEKSKFL
ncbi:putative membrane protein [Desulfobacter postgatei 2ac9]|nr:putative membrane protein [Desulfobacter postgatei 2ac9]